MIKKNIPPAVVATGAISMWLTVMVSDWGCVYTPPLAVPPESFFFSSRRRHTRSLCDWSSDVCLPISGIRHFPDLSKGSRHRGRPPIVLTQQRHGGCAPQQPAIRQAVAAKSPALAPHEAFEFAFRPGQRLLHGFALVEAH